MKYHKLPKLGTEENTSLVSDYKEGAAPKVLAKRFGCSTAAIMYHLRKQGVECMSMSERYIQISGLNEAALLDEKSEFAAYFAGIICSDGNVTGTRIKLTMKEDCKPLFDKIVKELNLPHDRVKKVKETFYNISFRSRKVVEYYKQLGLVENKSLVARVPEPYKYNRHYWRGHCCGDAGLSVNVKNGSEIPRLALVGSEQICKDFIKYCQHICGKEDVSSAIEQAGHSKAFCIVIKQWAAKLVVTEMYRDCNFFLDRKLETYKRVWENYETSFYNRRLYKANKTGCSGVFQRTSGNYLVSFKTKNLGIFKTLEEAIRVRKQAEENYTKQEIQQ